MARRHKIIVLGLEPRVQELYGTLGADGKPRSARQIALALQDEGHKVTPENVSEYLRSQNLDTAMTAAVSSNRVAAQRAVDRQLNILDSLRRAHALAWDTIRKLRPTEEELTPQRARAITAALAEIRQQLEFQAHLLELLFNADEVVKFQESVIEMLEEVTPDARERIIAKLRSKRSMAGLLRPGRGAGGSTGASR